MDEVPVQPTAVSRITPRPRTTCNRRPTSATRLPSRWMADRSDVADPLPPAAVYAALISALLTRRPMLRTSRSTRGICASEIDTQRPAWRSSPSASSTGASGVASLRSTIQTTEGMSERVISVMGSCADVGGRERRREPGAPADLPPGHLRRSDRRGLRFRFALPVGRRGDRDRRVDQAEAAEALAVTGRAVLEGVEALQLLLLRHSQADRGLENGEEDERGDRHPRQDGDDADELADELVRATAEQQALLPEVGVLAGEQADAQRAEHAAHAVHRDGAHRVVDLDHLLEELDREHDEDAGQGADEDSPGSGDGGRAGRDADEPGEQAVTGHADVGLAG